MITTPPTTSNDTTQDGSTIIIGSRNRPDLLITTVDSVLEGTHIPDEIIIVDQSDRHNDELATYVTSRQCDVRYIWSQTVGVSRSRNIGIHAASHERLVIIDDDMLAASDWFDELMLAMDASGDSAVITGRVLPTEAEIRGGFVPSMQVSMTPATYRKRGDYSILASCHLAAFKRTLEAVGAFDERMGPGTPFPAAEDGDLGIRLLEAGTAIRYVPEPVLYHRAWRGSARDFLQLRWSYGRGQGAFYLKHATRRDAMTLRHFVRDFRKHVSRAVRLQRGTLQALGNAVYAAGLVSGMVLWGIRVRILDQIRNRRP